MQHAKSDDREITNAELVEAVAALAELVSKQGKEIDALHKRLSLANQRSAQIEHYLGMRKHNFDPRDRLWEFAQVQNDVLMKQRPQSAFYKGELSVLNAGDEM